MIGMNAAKTTNYIEKCLKQKLRRLEFHKKISLNAYVVSTSRVELGYSKDLRFWNIMNEWIFP